MPAVTPDTATPPLSVSLVEGGSWSLADSKPANFTMVVVYRGHHCPLCKTYLGALNGLVDGFREAGIEPVAISMNDAGLAAQAKQEWELDKLPVGYGLDAATARAWGLYISEPIREGEPAQFSEPGLFVVRPDGRLFSASVGNMPWGRPAPQEILDKLKFALERGYPARGTA